MFLTGAWRNYDELEEWFTLNELLVTYDAAHEKEYRAMKWQAQIQGVEVNEPSNSNSEQAPEQGSLAERIAQRKQQQLEQQASEGSAEAFPGTGYRTIGG